MKFLVDFLGRQQVRNYQVETTGKAIISVFADLIT